MNNINVLEKIDNLSHRYRVEIEIHINVKFNKFIIYYAPNKIRSLLISNAVLYDTRALLIFLEMKIKEGLSKCY